VGCLLAVLRDEKELRIAPRSALDARKQWIAGLRYYGKAMPARAPFKNSCASAAEQFLLPNAFPHFPSSHVSAPRGADRSPDGEAETVHEWALPRGRGSSENGIESAVA